MDDENLKFVLLLEENKDILAKSQVPSIKKKKEEAMSIFIEKWSAVSAKEITSAALLTKVNNLKTRAKSALKRGSQLTAWQSKILNMKVKTILKKTRKI